MIKFDETKLNQLEQQVLRQLSAYAEHNPQPKIVEAADICGCSVSQVSKAIKKAGFRGYKQYIRYLYFGDSPQEKPLGELDRLKRFLAEFDPALVDEIVEMLVAHKKILFFGYGPSYICAQYVEYKLRFCLPAVIQTPPDEASLRSMIDDSSLLIILTTTGQYRSFEEISKYAKARGSDVIVVSEEFNSTLMGSCDRYFSLCTQRQSSRLMPHEKTRTVFFIFFEQVVQKLLNKERD